LPLADYTIPVLDDPSVHLPGMIVATPVIWNIYIIVWIKRVKKERADAVRSDAGGETVS